MNCRQCGEEVGEDARFCGSCGTRLDDPPEVAPLGSGAVEAQSERPVGSATIDPVPPPPPAAGLTGPPAPAAQMIPPPPVAVPPPPPAAAAPVAAPPPAPMAVPAPPLSPPYPYGYPPPMRQSTNGLAIASLVLGIVWIYWLGSILALIFGYIAKGQIDRSGGSQSGRGMAIAGIVLGWIGVTVLLLVIVAGVGVGLS